MVWDVGAEERAGDCGGGDGGRGAVRDIRGFIPGGCWSRVCFGMNELDVPGRKFV